MDMINDTEQLVTTLASKSWDLGSKICITRDKA